MQNIRSYLDYAPVIKKKVYIDSAATVIGRVTLEDDCSVWPNTVIRGDVNFINIGKETNIQDGAVLHVTHAGEFSENGSPLLIGARVTVGHNATLHGCTIENEVLVGMSSIILDGAFIEKQTFIAAGSLVPPNQTLKSGFLYCGNPIRQKRALTSKEILFLSYSANHYVKLKETYLCN